ncbi:diaminopimelate epimerase [Arcticibacter eurypsychrophilus]|uniref:diaminopimelate epimerase n=1 Tax=Arcticibacter eurypsychrophilus TaxID=1434752 RepID=UPI00084D8E52|nr:diaminopimelate epimerase [Arcticibacter eurypsychrophilus]
MKVHFYKYQGAGNDFILVDNRNNSINHQNPALIASLCDRRFGVGGDGLLFLQLKAGFDFEMIYYNADGQPSSMCGNGGRCIVAFARHLGVIGLETNFLAVDGPHYAKISDQGDFVSLQMSNVNEISTDGAASVLDTGSPHYVIMASDLENKDVYTEGKAIRYNDTYKEKGININFVEEMDGHYFVRTYERGVEDETFACGTGATAVALAMAKSKNQTGDGSTKIKVLGGKLNVRFKYDGTNFDSIFLEGPAQLVFEGDISIPEVLPSSANN